MLDNLESVVLTKPITPPLGKRKTPCVDVTSALGGVADTLRTSVQVTVNEEALLTEIVVELGLTDEDVRSAFEAVPEIQRTSAIQIISSAPTRCGDTGMLQ